MKVEDIKKIGVAGAGLMGHGIAINSAMWGYPTMMQDLNEEILQKGMKAVKADLKIYVEEGLIDQKRADACVANISTTTDLAELAANSDFITEVIVERTEDKYELFNKLDKLCPPHTIIASNTSGLILSDFGRGVKRQDKIVLTHYFSPPTFVPGVEVAKGPGTSDETFEITYELMKKWKKVPIRVLKERSGYLINRLQRALMREAWLLWAEGVATAEELDRGYTATCGFRMPHEGPLIRTDYSGGWRWPKDVLSKSVDKMLQDISQPTPEIAEKIKQARSAGRPLILDPNTIEEKTEEAYREYARRLKDLYWSKEG